jgi:serine protease Do
MKRAKFAVFGLVLTGAVVVAVASLGAQGRWTSFDNQDARGRARVLLDGRGAQIGVTVEEVAEGVRIDEVDSDSPASKAGLRTGDIVVEVDGERVRSARQFSRLIQESPQGRSVNLAVTRDGARQTVAVTPEARGFDFAFDGDLIGREVERGLRELGPQLRDLEPRLREFRDNVPFDFDFDGFPRITSPRARLGVQLNELTPELAEYFGAKGGGVLVSRVTEDSPAAKAGLKAGDVITSIDGGRIRDSDDLVDELRDKSGEVTLGIVRDRKESSVKATIEDTAARTPRVRRPA